MPTSISALIDSLPTVPSNALIALDCASASPAVFRAISAFICSASPSTPALSPFSPTLTASPSVRASYSPLAGNDADAFTSRPLSSSDASSPTSMPSGRASSTPNAPSIAFTVARVRLTCNDLEVIMIPLASEVTSEPRFSGLADPSALSLESVSSSVPKSPETSNTRSVSSCVISPSITVSRSMLAFTAGICAPKSDMPERSMYPVPSSDRYTARSFPAGSILSAPRAKSSFRVSTMLADNADVAASTDTSAARLTATLLSAVRVHGVTVSPMSRPNSDTMSIRLNLPAASESSASTSRETPLSTSATSSFTE